MQRIGCLRIGTNGNAVEMEVPVLQNVRVNESLWSTDVDAMKL